MTAAPTQNKPVIFLAFANDLANGGQYLRQLSEEARRLRTTLERGVEQGSHAAPYRVVVRQNATVEDLFDVFRAHRDRIVLFHFGGHANGYELYFENAQGQPTAARAEGLAAFLGRQRGLRLVFLNGYSSRAQAQKLLAANMDVVIATERDVEDAVALHFADHFYRGLVSVAPLETAFHEAVAAAQAVAGANHGRRHLRPEEVEDAPLNTGGWPWGLYVRPGDEAKLQWKLVDALPADHTPSAPPTVPPPSLPVDWQQASQYAAWKGGRLPTEAEWEKACRGTDARIYPWGDELPTSKLANFNYNEGTVTDVGNYLDGQSPYGLLDMAGNVWEWTSSQDQAYPYQPDDGHEEQTGDAARTWRGGAFNDLEGSVRCANRNRHPPTYTDNLVGFRFLSPGF